MKNKINKLNISTVAIFLPVMLFIFGSFNNILGTTLVKVLGKNDINDYLVMLKKKVLYPDQLYENGETIPSIKEIKKQYLDDRLLLKALCNSAYSEVGTDATKRLGFYYANWVFSYARFFADQSTKSLISGTSVTIDDDSRSLLQGILQLKKTLVSASKIEMSECPIFDITTISVTDDDMLTKFSQSLQELYEAAYTQSISSQSRTNGNLLSSAQYFAQLVSEIITHYLESTLEVIQFKNAFNEKVDNFFNSVVTDSYKNNATVFTSLVKKYLKLSGFNIQVEDNISNEFINEIILEVKKRIAYYKKGTTLFNNKKPILTSSCSLFSLNSDITRKGGRLLFAGITCITGLIKTIEYTKSAFGNLATFSTNAYQQGIHSALAETEIVKLTGKQAREQLGQLKKRAGEKSDQIKSYVKNKADQIDEAPATQSFIGVVAKGAVRTGKGLFNRAKDWWDKKWNSSNKE